MTRKRNDRNDILRNGWTMIPEPFYIRERICKKKYIKSVYMEGRMIFLSNRKHEAKTRKSFFLFF